MVKVWLIPVLCTAAFGGTIVVPNAETSTPGNGSGPPNAGPGIYQELFGAGQFASVSQIDITGVSFRAAPGAGALDFTLGTLNLYLSTSPNYPNSTSGPLMSSTFANNIGPDNTLVFSGTATLSAPGCSGPGACPFGPAIDFATPFDYNPANGRLLFDAVFTDLTPVSGEVDAEGFNPPGGSVAQVVEFGSTTATTGSFDYGGDIAEFTFTSVPEPASWTMMAGAAALLWLGRRRRSGWLPGAQTGK